MHVASASSLEFLGKVYVPIKPCNPCNAAKFNLAPREFFIKMWDRL